MKKAITEQQFNEALNRVAATTDGQIVLACLKEFVNFDGDILVAGDPQSTYANATLRRAFLYLKNRIHPDHLKAIYFNYTRKAETNERSSIKRTNPSERTSSRPSLTTKQSK